MSSIFLVCILTDDSGSNEVDPCHKNKAKHSFVVLVKSAQKHVKTKR